MPDWNTFFVFTFLAILILSAGFIVEQSYEDQLNKTTYTNESLTITSFDTALELDNSNIEGARYDNDTTVRNATDVKLERGTDYSWFQDNGTISFSNTDKTASNMDVNVTYTANTPDELQLGFFQLFQSFIGILPELLLVGAVGVSIWVISRS